MRKDESGAASREGPGGAGGRSLTVVVTRPHGSGAALARALEAEGFRVELFPALEVVAPADASPLRAAAARAAAGGYDWIVFTSANGVRAFAAALAESEGPSDAGVGGAHVVGRTDAGPGGGQVAGRSGAGPGGTQVAVVGPATAAAAAAEGWRAALAPEPERYTAEGLLEAFGSVAVEGARMLLPLAEAARDVLPRGLRARGARIEVVVAYRTLLPSDAPVERLRALLEAGRLDLVTFASPSAAEAFLAALGEAALALPAVAIGPVTAGAAERLGYRVEAVAEPHTSEGLVSAVVAWVAGRGGEG